MQMISSGPFRGRDDFEGDGDDDGDGDRDGDGDGGGNDGFNLCDTAIGTRWILK